MRTKWLIKVLETVPGTSEQLSPQCIRRPSGGRESIVVGLQYVQENELPARNSY